MSKEREWPKSEEFKYPKGMGGAPEVHKSGKGLDVINGQFRHLITIAGGMLVSRGVIQESEAEVLLSLAMIAFGLGWSVYAKLSKGSK